MEICPFVPAGNAPDGSGGGVVKKAIFDKPITIEGSKPSDVRNELEKLGKSTLAEKLGQKPDDFTITRLDSDVE